MDVSHDIPDSTDWLSTPLSDVAALENALHCEICKEFYDTPMITSCCHTFCSKCIRTSLSNDGKCPACRSSDQANKLRNNWALQEVVDKFVAARPAALTLARKEQEALEEAKRPGKRKRVIPDSDDAAEIETEGKVTRRKSKRIATTQSSQPEAIEIDDGEEDDDFRPESPEDDGLVECPLGCGKRMKIEAVEPHLDRCEDEKKQAGKPKPRIKLNGFGSPKTASSIQTPRPQDRLSELNYSLMKENAMRKKFDELGIPAWGPKTLLVRRHTEWVNLWNANCDSNHPRTKRELLHDLDSWERTQGGRATAGKSQSNDVMKKDFDGNGWANKNKDDFSKLIAAARQKRATPTTSTPEPSNTETTQATAPPATEDTPMTQTGEPETNSRFFAQDAQLANADPSTAPYANNPEAIAVVRAKVDALNAGETIEPVMNAGFHVDTPSHPAAPPPSSQQSHSFANGEHHHPEHSSTRSIEERGGAKQVPMFAVPEQPIHDLDGNVDESR